MLSEIHRSHQLERQNLDQHFDDERARYRTHCDTELHKQRTSYEMLQAEVEILKLKNRDLAAKLQAQERYHSVIDQLAGVD